MEEAMEGVEGADEAAEVGAATTAAAGAEAAAIGRAAVAAAGAAAAAAGAMSREGVVAGAVAAGEATTARRWGQRAGGPGCQPALMAGIGHVPMMARDPACLAC